MPDAYKSPCPADFYIDSESVIFDFPSFVRCGRAAFVGSSKLNARKIQKFSNTMASESAPNRIINCRLNASWMCEFLVCTLHAAHCCRPLCYFHFPARMREAVPRSLPYNYSHRKSARSTKHWLTHLLSVYIYYIYVSLLFRVGTFFYHSW